MTIRVLLVDDQEAIRIGYRIALGTRPGLEVVGEAADGETALAMLASTHVDVVLMDVRMPGMGGVEATRRIRAIDDSLRVIMLTTFDLDEHARDALAAGASGFLLKDTPLDEVAVAIEHVHAGDAVVAPSTTRRLLEHVVAARPPAPNPARDALLATLTAREHDVLRLLARGRSNAEIAHELVIAEGTAKVHVGRILAKLDLRDRVQAVVLAYESGLVAPGDE